MDQILLRKREQLLNEYSQAVHSYQNAVWEMNEAREHSPSGILCNFLVKADAAKYTLNSCRDRYQEYCTLME